MSSEPLLFLSCFLYLPPLFLCLLTYLFSLFFSFRSLFFFFSSDSFLSFHFCRSFISHFSDALRSILTHYSSSARELLLAYPWIPSSSSSSESSSASGLFSSRSPHMCLYRLFRDDISALCSDPDRVSVLGGACSLFWPCCLTCTACPGPKLRISFSHLHCRSRRA